MAPPIFICQSVCPSVRSALLLTSRLLWVGFGLNLVELGGMIDVRLIIDLSKFHKNRFSDDVIPDFFFLQRDRILRQKEMQIMSCTDCDSSDSNLVCRIKRMTGTACRMPYGVDQKLWKWPHMDLPIPNSNLQHLSHKSNAPAAELSGMPVSRQG